MEDEGKPILMSVSIPKTFEADFVLATLLGNFFYSMVFVCKYEYSNLSH